MGIRLRRALSVGMLCFGALLLTACAPADDIAAFNRARVAADALPALLQEMVADDGGDLDTSRLLGTDDNGFDYFAMKGAKDGYCLVMVSFAHDRWSSACASALPLAVTSGNVRAELVSIAEGHAHGDDAVEVVGGHVIVSRN